MEKLRLKAPGKINLGLDIIGKRADGYHDIKTLMHTISLYDELTFAKAEKTSLICDDPDIPGDTNNIVIKCVLALESHVKRELPVAITLKKNIPTRAGLGGGSADGACTLRALNFLYDLNVGLEELCEAGKGVGADIPFMVRGGFALCEGIGERITPIENTFSYPLLLVKPNFSVDTKAAYDFSDNAHNQPNCDFERILASLEKPGVCEARNDFEEYLAAFHPKALEIKAELYESGAFLAGLSGSGSCFYGIFEQTETAQRAAEVLSGKYPFVCTQRLCDSQGALIDHKGLIIK
ncbi:MAG: 4-(cytidine 5'-diphospho)-2-C-methyl-D-erythritol kinase [Eubacteriaceae bacterium]|nr:4-(cytidine 5'-diphospho)-2-C-methyl-D-erythritol kinase [Eubacteriaceae bacterium]